MSNKLQMMCDGGSDNPIKAEALFTLWSPKISWGKQSLK